jgi:ParB/RepB/Spo0J family partition protein
MKVDDYGVRAIGVKSLPTEKLKPNPHNPRMLFDRADLHVLRESIERVGILVPLTVYREKSTGDHVILDGQRRWMCAQDVGLKTIPVNEVAEPTTVQNIVTMFQIHKLRKDWELMPTALKLEVLMRALREVKGTILAELTGLDEAVVVRCKKLLSYNKRYQDMMLDADPDKRVKADFFIELYAVRNDREVKKFSWFKKDKFTDDMLRKFEEKGIKSVTDFRIVKQYINNAVKAKKTSTISKRLAACGRTTENA